MWQKFIETSAPYRWADLFIKPFLDFQRLLAQSRMLRVKRRVAPRLLHVIEHRSRTLQHVAIVAKYGHSLLAEARNQLHRMRSRHQRVPDVWYALVVQCPTRLLWIHRKPHLPELWMTHDLSMKAQRPKLSDGGHEARRLQQQRDAAVRCSDWLGIVREMELAEQLARRC